MICDDSGRWLKTDDVPPPPLTCSQQGYGQFNCDPADMLYAGDLYDIESRVLETLTFSLAVLVSSLH